MQTESSHPPGRKVPGASMIAAALLPLAAAGCHHPFPLTANLEATAGVNGTVEVRMPPVIDPGTMVPTIVRGAPAGPGASRVALVDLDGLILNQNLTGLYSIGDNPVAAFREKLEAAANDPMVRAVVIRINSPGGGVAASDILAEELRRFRLTTGKPVVACLMDVATGGAYYLAVGCDRIIALPTAITGGVGAIFNHYNMVDTMGQVGMKVDIVKSGPLVDMGTITDRLPEETRVLFQQMTDGFRDRFAARVARARPLMTVGDRAVIGDGRILAASQALGLHMIDGLGYLDDAIGEAERLAGCGGCEVVLFERSGYPTHSIYSIVPNVPLQGEAIPASVPGLDRTRLPTFLYLWEPDPTLTKTGGH